jgi:hypothetical protein
LVLLVLTYEGTGRGGAGGGSPGRVGDFSRALFGSWEEAGYQRNPLSTPTFSSRDAPTSQRPNRPLAKISLLLTSFDLSINLAKRFQYRSRVETPRVAQDRDLITCRSTALPPGEGPPSPRRPRRRQGGLMGAFRVADRAGEPGQGPSNRTQPSLCAPASRCRGTARKRGSRTGPARGFKASPDPRRPVMCWTPGYPRLCSVLRTLNGNFMKTTGLDLKRRLKMSDIIII